MRRDEPKANLNIEQMDAVRIMTIHSAKGLEFPVVFIPGLEERFQTYTREHLVFEGHGGVYFKSIPDTQIRNTDPDFVQYREREREEMKRLFYVAVTRASDVLILMGQWDHSGDSFFSYLIDSLEIEEETLKATCEPEIAGFSLLTEDDVNMLYEHTSCIEIGRKRIHTNLEVKKVPVKKRIPWEGVTESVEIMRHHGRGWQILGEVIHRLLEEVSRGEIRDNQIESTLRRWLLQRGIRGDALTQALQSINTQINTLKSRGIWDEIVLPIDRAYVEIPFIYDAGDRVYTGRIDRIIIRDETCHVYDYKTFPFDSKEVPYLMREYAPQLRIYREAAGRLFKRHCRAYIIFTHTGQILEVN